jgi:hypothetical protein
MLTRCNMVRGLLATMMGVMIVAAAVGTQPPPSDEARPDTAGAVAAALRVRDWVRAFETPKLTDEASRLSIDRCEGVCVILRHRGRVVGAGQDLTGDALMVRRAAGRAMNQAWGDEVISSLAQADRLRVGQALTFEIEAAGPARPLPGRSFGQLAEQIEPGIEGVLLRREEERRAVFPSRLLATNHAERMDSQLHALSAEFGLQATGYGALSDRHGVRAYGFETIHLVQRAPGRRPMQVLRGRSMDAAPEATAETIRAFADDLVDHLYMSLWTGEEALGVMGDYQPHLDEYRPLTAPPRDQALCAWALLAYAGTPGLDVVKARRARTAAESILIELTDVLTAREQDLEIKLEEDPLDDPAACAAIVCALTAHSPLLSEPVLGALLRDASAQVAPGDKEVMVAAPAMRAMIGLARVRLLARGAGGMTAETARATLDAAWASVDGPARISLLPWIYDAEAELAEITGEPMRRVEALRELAVLLNAARIDDPNRREDEQGGFLLAGAGRRTPDAQTTRPACFYAAALSDERIIKAGEATLAWERHRATMRFLMRLAVTDADMWAIRAPQKAIGGVRRAPMACDQPVAVQAMSLFTAARTLGGLSEVKVPEPADSSD